MRAKEWGLKACGKAPILLCRGPSDAKREAYLTLSQSCSLRLRCGARRQEEQRERSRLGLDEFPDDARLVGARTIDDEERRPIAVEQQAFEEIDEDRDPPGAGSRSRRSGRCGMQPLGVDGRPGIKLIASATANIRGP